MRHAGVEMHVDDILQSIVTKMQAQLPNVPDEFWRDFLTQVDRDEMYLSAAQLVSEYYGTNELQEIVTFLETDVGKKFILGQKELDRQQAYRSVAWARKVQKDLIFELQLNRHM